VARHESLVLDYTHEKLDVKGRELLAKLAEETRIRDKIQAQFSGAKINKTENRSVLHTALRMPKGSSLEVDGKDVVKDVHEVLEAIRHFSEAVRKGDIKGATGKQLRNVVTIGIGGSYLSIEFVYEALRSEPSCKEAANGRTLRFLANVDPIDFSRSVEGLNAEETLFVINSKTFTTAETMLNARSCRNWLLEQFKAIGETDEKKVVAHHMSACSTNLPETDKFGISKQNVFGFWDFVGGRFSVWSAIGVLPLSLHFGFETMQRFLEGGYSIDQHLLNEKDTNKNVPLLLGLLGFYRTTIQKHTSRAILPYCQALCKFVPHVQQLDMESNGKGVNLEGKPLSYETAVVNFGEPGTNGQHSFYQLLHQGRPIPSEFIGFTKSQHPVHITGEAVSNHDELMSNFFSQPDALALGKTIEELQIEKTPEALLGHKFFPGDRPSSSLLFVGKLTPYHCGQLLALYEHRTSVEGYLWDIDSYDQWGVELGKILAKKVRGILV